MFLVIVGPKTLTDDTPNMSVSVVQFLRQEVGRPRGSVRQHGHSHRHGGDEGAGQPK